MTVEGVRSKDISIVWMGPDGSEPSGDSIGISGTVIRRRLVFSPFHTSDRGQYTCTGRIAADSVGVNVSDTLSVEIRILSEYWPSCIHSASFVICTCIIFLSVPAPAVFVSLNTDDTVYQGTELVITCTVTVDSAVNTGFDVIITWNSTPLGAMNGPYVTITDTSGSGDEYSSTVTISPVDTTDSATYICTASVTPTTTENDFIIPSVETTRRVKIVVLGEIYLMILFGGVELVFSLLQS